jgi:hypothetical protein
MAFIRPLAGGKKRTGWLLVTAFRFLLLKTMDGFYPASCRKQLKDRLLCYAPCSVEPLAFSLYPFSFLRVIICKSLWLNLYILSWLKLYMTFHFSDATGKSRR